MMNLKVLKFTTQNININIVECKLYSYGHVWIGSGYKYKHSGM